MTDTRGLAVAAVALRVLADRVSARADQVKSQLAEALDPGDRKIAALDSGVKVGTISFANGRASARVVDPAALTRWVVENYPGEIVETVRPAFLDAILSASKSAGLPMAPDGTLDVPGIELGMSRPYVSVKPDPAGVPALVEAIRANELLALDGSDGSEAA